MATITRLPAEVIEIILENRNISIEDIENLQSTCEIFQKISFSNRFWKNKYLQREKSKLYDDYYELAKKIHSTPWSQTAEIFLESKYSCIFNSISYITLCAYHGCPTAKKKYFTVKQMKFLDRLDIKDEIEKELKCMEKLQYYISLMSNYTLSETDKNELECLLRSIAENSLLYYFILDELNRIISTRLTRKIDSNFNLTERYNINLIVYYLKQYRFIYKEMKFVNMPKKTQLLEKQLTIVTQYFQPQISYSVINIWLDDIVQEVLTRLKNKYPKHSIFSISVEQFSFWRNNNIDDNFWNETEAMQIMSILEEFIFSDLEIDKLHQLLIISDHSKDYINYISEYFRMYLLHFTYHSVARRLGIHCVLTSLDQADIAIIWKPKYDTEDWHDGEYFHMSKISRLYPSNIVRGSCRNKFVPHLFNIKMIQNIIYFYEVIHKHQIIYKWELHIFCTFLAKCLLDEDINIEFEYKNITMSIEIRLPNTIKTLVDRNENVKFAVGMIVAHSWKYCSRYNIKLNDHIGVIIGWHCKCDPEFSYELDKVKFPYLSQCNSNYHICKCNRSSDLYSANQSHYIILTQNNTICYVKQDDILKCSPKEIDNIEIGRYFTRFEGTYYVPNNSLAEEYPNDTIEMLKILSNS